MLTEPDDLDRRELLGLLVRSWGIDAASFEYLPLGFGSHHWKVVDGAGEARFVTVDDLEAGFQAGSSADEAFDALERAFGTAWSLRHEAELEFVVAGIRDREGSIVRRLDARYAVTVLPFVVGASCSFGRYESSADRKRVARTLGRLHAATPAVPATLPRHDDFRIPSRDVLDRALDELDADWATGAFAEPARRALQERAALLGERLGEWDELAHTLRAAPRDWVVTHGEPHRANVIETDDGLLLVDWDTTMVAPRERDLWMVLDDAATGLDEYAAEVGPVTLDDDAVELYRQRWDLKDIAAYVGVLRRPHAETDDTAKTIDGLRASLQRL